MFNPSGLGIYNFFSLSILILPFPSCTFSLFPHSFLFYLSISVSLLSSLLCCLSFSHFLKLYCLTFSFLCSSISTTFLFYTLTSQQQQLTQHTHTHTKLALSPAGWKGMAQEGGRTDDPMNRHIALGELKPFWHCRPPPSPTPLPPPPLTRFECFQCECGTTRGSRRRSRRKAFVPVGGCEGRANGLFVRMACPRGSVTVSSTGKNVCLSKIACGNTSSISSPALALISATDQCHQRHQSNHNNNNSTSSAAEDSKSASASAISSSNNSYHSAVSCGGRARCCVVPSSSFTFSSPSASLPSSENRLSRADANSGELPSGKSNSSSDSSSSSLSLSLSLPVINSTSNLNNNNIGCTLCQQSVDKSYQQQQQQQRRASSEETLKRVDSRLTVPRGSASSSQQSPSAAAGCLDTIHSQTTTSSSTVVQQHQFVEVDKQLNATGAVAARNNCACEECMLACQREQQLQHEQFAGTSGAGVSMAQHQRQSGTGALSIALANAQLAAPSGPTTSSSGASSSAKPHSHHRQQQLYYSNSGGGGGGGGGPSSLISANAQTIEEQIKQIDRISKECDHSRKTLEQINRRLDDLNDEVRRYREFLGHEKARRDPTLYKTSTAEPLSSYNDGICRLIDSLTTQLTMEWTEKLRSIQNQTIAKSVSEKG